MMKRFFAACVLLVVATPLLGDDHPVLKPPTVSTFSIVAIDPANGDMGVAVASRYFSVGSVVPWALAGVGAVATQANVNVGYGPKGIDLLREGLSAKQVLDRLLLHAVEQLRPGGTLVYAVCSLQEDEGPARVHGLLARDRRLTSPPRARRPSKADWTKQRRPPSAFTCPECHGTLWQVNEGAMPRFVCR